MLRSLEPLIVNGSARFRPRDGTVEPCSIHNHIKLGAIHVDADNLRCWLSHLELATKNVPTPPPSSLSTAASPWLKSPFSAVSTSVDIVSDVLTPLSLLSLRMFVFKLWRSEGSKVKWWVQQYLSQRMC